MQKLQYLFMLLLGSKRPLNEEAICLCTAKVPVPAAATAVPPTTNVPSLIAQSVATPSLTMLSPVMFPSSTSNNVSTSRVGYTSNNSSTVNNPSSLPSTTTNHDTTDNHLATTEEFYSEET